jgi:Acetyltransferase (GNAT) domain
MINVEIRNCSPLEMPLIFRFASMAGKDPGLNDYDLFYRIDPNAFFIAVKEMELVGSIASIGYGSDFGFIGLHLINDDLQNTAVADKLLEVALDRLGSRNIGINCQETQIPYYANYGFKPYYKIFTYEGTSDAIIPSMEDFTNPFQHPFDPLEEFDKKHFPYDRKNFLMIFLNQPRSLSLAKFSDNRYTGYGLSIPSESGFKISPLLADNPETAEDLLRALAGHLDKGSRFSIDIPEENINGMHIAEKSGMKKIKETVRMYYRTEPNLALKNIYSFTSNELG